MIRGRHLRKRSESETRKCRAIWKRMASDGLPTPDSIRRSVTATTPKRSAAAFIVQPRAWRNRRTVTPSLRATRPCIAFRSRAPLLRLAIEDVERTAHPRL